MIRINTKKYYPVAFVVAAVCIFFDFVVMGSAILAVTGLISIYYTVKAEFVTRGKSLDPLYQHLTPEKEEQFYAPLISRRGNVYKVYHIEPDSILDSL